MFPFDVILFDVGGVLLTNGWGTGERTQVLESFNLDKADFEKRHPVPNDSWERDAISAEAYLEETVFYEPRVSLQFIVRGSRLFVEDRAINCEPRTAN